MALIPTEKSYLTCGSRRKNGRQLNLGNSLSSEILPICDVSIALISSRLHNFFSLVKHVSRSGLRAVQVTDKVGGTVERLDGGADLLLCPHKKKA